MCAGAGDTLSVGARSALADMRGPGVRLVRAGWRSRRTSARCLCVLCMSAHTLLLLCSYMYASFNTL